MLLNEIATVSAQVARESGRKAKSDLIASLLAQLAPGRQALDEAVPDQTAPDQIAPDQTAPDQDAAGQAAAGEAAAVEVPLVVAFLSGELRQRQIGVGYAALADLLGGRGATSQATPPAQTATLTVTEVDGVFAEIGAVTGSGSQAARRELLAALFARATETERGFLIQLVAGELRQGALEGVMIEAVAQAAEVPAAEIRRALLLGGSLPAVATAALCGSADPLGPDTLGSGTVSGPVDALTALRSFGLRVGRPLRPMLAAAAPSIEAALEKVSPAGVEWKIDGIRVQVHKDGDRITVFTRTLDDITARVPEVTEAVRALPAQAAVLDGEAVALDPAGRPRPFQVTASRTGTREAESVRVDVPLTPFFFDLLHLDGADLIDTPAADRYAALSELLPAALVIPRVVTEDPAVATEFFTAAVAQGHEGVVVKSLGAPYATGRRGSEWIKVKPRHTLDLVVLAAEWGNGRRQGWLSNLHLGARDPDTGGLVMLGKTFKGLTDEMLAWQTERLLELATPGQASLGTPRRPSSVVRVRPELVVEIAFDGVQASTRYPGGLALRFARVLRHRPDKNAATADTIDAVRAVAPQ